MRTSKKHPIIGIDFGGVICDNQKSPQKHREITLISEIFQYCTENLPMHYAFKAIKTLIGLCGHKNVWIISRASQNGELVIRWWLHQHNFFEQTGFREGNIRFCRERAEKAEICQELGITCMIDDRYSVLKHLNSKVKRILFNPIEEEKKLAIQENSKMIIVPDWSHYHQILKAINL